MPNKFITLNLIHGNKIKPIRINKKSIQYFYPIKTLFNQDWISGTRVVFGANNIIDVTNPMEAIKMPNKPGRPKKHNQTKTKTMRLPTDLITELENQRKEGESFTDVLIRFVKLGMIG